MAGQTQDVLPGGQGLCDQLLTLTYIKYVNTSLKVSYVSDVTECYFHAKHDVF